MELKVKRGNKGRFESLKKTEEKVEQKVWIVNAEDFDKRVMEAVQTFSDPASFRMHTEAEVQEPETNKPLIPIWVNVNRVLLAILTGMLIVFFYYAAIYVAVRI